MFKLRFQFCIGNLKTVHKLYSENMESIKEILARKDFDTPDEITALRDYIQRRYGVKCKVTLRSGSLILSVPNSALAGTLQMEKPKIIKACGIKAKLIIRVSH